MNLSRHALVSGRPRRRARRVGTVILAAAAVVSAVGGGVGAASPAVRRAGDGSLVRRPRHRHGARADRPLRRRVVEEFNDSQDAIELQLSSSTTRSPTRRWRRRSRQATHPTSSARSGSAGRTRSPGSSSTSSRSSSRRASTCRRTTRRRSTSGGRRTERSRHCRSACPVGDLLQQRPLRRGRPRLPRRPRTASPTPTVTRGTWTRSPSWRCC